MARRKRNYKRATKLERNLGFGYRKGHYQFVGCSTLFLLPFAIGAAIIALHR